ncbi:MAG: N-acetyl-gamma-glutamyl-phosphate reductase [Rhizobiaceae bacterium]
MAPKIFIDGEHGTTGLQIAQRLSGRGDIELLTIAHEDRRDMDVRADLLKAADIAILCLPDDGAREAVELAKGSQTRFIDASTAHRTADDWVFGFAELEPGHAARIAAADKVSNPGCYSTGAIALLRPLTSAGVLPADYPVTINAISGYSGGGKALIARFEDENDPNPVTAPAYLYALALAHKHVPEIQRHGQLTRRPLFTPNVGRYRQGMTVQVPLHLDLLGGTPDVADLHAALEAHYAGQDVVQVVPLEVSAGLEMVEPMELNDTNTMKLHVFGKPGGGQANLVAVLDNLGKGASGACVQCMDLMIGA